MRLPGFVGFGEGQGQKLEGRVVRCRWYESVAGQRFGSVPNNKDELRFIRTEGWRSGLAPTAIATLVFPSFLYRPSLQRRID